MGAFEDRVPLAEIAALAEVRPSAVSNWRQRYPDFPDGHRSSGQELFAADDIARWLAGRKIPQNSLKANEDAGFTYGDRFVRNRGISETDAATGSASRLSHWEPPVSAARGELGDYHDATRSAELILGLVYLKTTMPGLWQEIVQQSNDGQRARNLLGRAEAASEQGSQRIPLFLAAGYASVADHSLGQLLNTIDAIDLGSSSQGVSSVAAQVCDALLAIIAREMGKRGSRFVPESLARCMAELAAPSQGESIYDPFCGSGELLAAAAAQIEGNGMDPDTVRISGQAPTEWSWRMTSVSLAMHGIHENADIHLTDALNDHSFSGRHFDVILANPPFNEKKWPAAWFDDQRWPYGTPPSSNANFAWLQHAATRLTHGGRAIVVMPNGAASTQNSVELSIRARMVEAGVIECVIALPGHLFRTTAIPVSLWILRSPGGPISPEVLFIDARSMGVMADRTQRVLATEDIERIWRIFTSWQDRKDAGAYEATEGLARAAGLEEIREHDYVLTPPRYAGAASPAVSLESALAEVDNLRSRLHDLQSRSSETSAMLEAKISSIVSSRAPDPAFLRGRSTIPLGAVCDILAGPGAVDRGKNQRSRTPLILPRNIGHNRITHVDLDTVGAQAAARLARYRVSAGDIICPRTGTLGRYGLIMEWQNDWLLGPGCMRLRPVREIDSGYLTYYLGSPSAEKWLMDNATGSAIRQINTSTLSRMPVVIPELVVQRKIVSILDAFAADAVIDSEVGEAREKMREVMSALLMNGSPPPNEL